MQKCFYYVASTKKRRNRMDARIGNFYNIFFATNMASSYKMHSTLLLSTLVSGSALFLLMKKLRHMKIPLVFCGKVGAEKC